MRDALQAHVDLVLAHVSHVYDTGASIYYTLGAVNDGDEDRALARYDAAWEAGQRAALAAGATASHHHGVGLLRAPYLPEELGPAGFDVLRRVKDALDPDHLLNPGKLGIGTRGGDHRDAPRRDRRRRPARRRRRRRCAPRQLLPEDVHLRLPRHLGDRSRDGRPVELPPDRQRPRRPGGCPWSRRLPDRLAAVQRVPRLPGPLRLRPGRPGAGPGRSGRAGRRWRRRPAAVAAAVTHVAEGRSPTGAPLPVAPPDDDDLTTLLVAGCRDDGRVPGRGRRGAARRGGAGGGARPGRMLRRPARRPRCTGRGRLRSAAPRRRRR